MTARATEAVDRLTLASHRAMMARCYSPSHESYPNYGAKGIVVCDRWHSPIALLQDLGPRPSRDHSLERDSSASNYEPGRVRWATTREQHRNRSDNVFVTIGDETLCVADWADRNGLNRRTVYQRLWWGWDPELAVTAPARPNARWEKYRAEQLKEQP